MADADRVHLFFAAGLFLVLSLAGANICYSAVEDFTSARASGKWLQVDGVVLSPQKQSGELRYAYIYNGDRFEGRRLSFLTRGKIGVMPDTTPGSRVLVYVEPEAPSLSVLVPGGSGRRFAIWFAVGGLVVFIGVAGLVRVMMAFDFPELDVSRPKSVAGAGSGSKADPAAYAPAE